MRLKTFIATYLLFLCILFSSLGIVAVYMANSQTEILKEKSVGEYHSIAATLAKDIAVIYGRSAGFPDMDSAESVNSLVKGYTQYYRRYNIEIAVDDLSLPERSGGGSSGSGGDVDGSDGSDGSSGSSGSGDMDGGDGGSSSAFNEISFVRQEQEHFIRIIGMLPEPFQFYQLSYYLNITKNIMETQNIQNILLLFAVIFSVFTAIALYFILSGIFKPLGAVADISRKIADGQYDERIYIRGKHELAEMAADFNRMAEIIEKQISFLEAEAVGKQQFVDNFAHEIRTPLTTIYGYAEYMQKASLDEKEIIESAQYIMDESSHMKNISNSLLELATLRNYAAVKSKIYIPRLFDEISRSMEKSLREHNIQLICNYEVDTIDGQEDLIKSLLINLCHNALKSCTPDEGIIHLGAERQGGNIVISVSDNGCGIPGDSIEKITEPFYRVDKARSREQGGAGLGLTLCKQIVEAHGAGMIIESVVGMGTTVKITFTSS